VTWRLVVLAGSSGNVSGDYLALHNLRSPTAAGKAGLAGRQAEAAKIQQAKAKAGRRK